MGSNVSQSFPSNLVLNQGFVTPTPNQVVKNIYTGATASGTTVYTVTAGKTLYILGCSVTNAGSAGNKNIYFTVDGSVILDAYLPQLTSFLFTGGVVSSIASGKALVLNHNIGASNCSATIWGFEQ